MKDSTYTPLTSFQINMVVLFIAIMSAFMILSSMTALPDPWPAYAINIAELLSNFLMYLFFISLGLSMIGSIIFVIAALILG